MMSDGGVGQSVVVTCYLRFHWVLYCVRHVLLTFGGAACSDKPLGVLVSTQVPVLLKIYVYM